MMKKPSSYSADSLTAPSCHGHSFPCSSWASCNNYCHFSQFRDQLYGPLYTRLWLCTKLRLWSQFQIYLNGEFSSFFQLLEYIKNSYIQSQHKNRSLKITFHILKTLPTYKYIHFKTCPRSIAGVSSSQALLGFLITAPPSVCVPDVIGALAVWIQRK